MNRFHREFAAPGQEYRSVPYWVWNGFVTKKRIRETLRQFADNGIGGVLIHARVGLMTGYLTDEWFSLWKTAMKECARLGLSCNIFDENNFPPPYAGGHVMSALPHAGCHHAVAQMEHDVATHPETVVLGRFDLVEGQVRRLADKENPSGKLLRIDLQPCQGGLWFGGLGYPDITRREVVQAFLASTHEQYYKRFGRQFGKVVRMTFDDEPGLRWRTNGIPMSNHILQSFRRAFGYDAAERVHHLFVDATGAEATRFDYYLHLQTLLEENYLKPLHDWTKKHSIHLTGHFWEHEWPAPYFIPDNMAAERWLDIPGVDVLGHQYTPEKPAQQHLTLLTLRELDSVANQLGQRRRICEAYGAGGYEVTLQNVKQIGDWILNNGVNIINEHLSFQTIHGSRKYDCPTTFSDHSAWWPLYRSMADHHARLSLVAASGEKRCRLLVLHPTTTGWIRAAKQNHAPLEKLCQSQGDLVAWLCERQVDFDLGNELILRNYGRVTVKGLEVGQRAYRVVLLPENMENLCEWTLALLTKFLSRQGQLILLGRPPSFVNGRPDTRPAELLDRHAGQVKRVVSLKEMQQTLDAWLPPLVLQEDGDHLPTSVSHQMRELPGGDRLHVFFNVGPKTVETKVRLDGASVLSLDTRTGGVAPSDTTLRLAVGETAVWQISRKASPALPPTPRFHRVAEVTNFEEIRRVSDNAISLDRCDLDLGGVKHEGMDVVVANRTLWQHHGYPHSVWDRSVQFRRNYLDLPPFDANSGFEATYRFEADAWLKKHGDLQLAVENPAWYKVTLNGRVLSFARGQRWLDESIRRVPIGPLLQAGVNTVTVSARPFDVRCEIDRVYLTGNFGVKTAPVAFRLVKPTPLATGDWTQQGLITYPGSVSYRTTFTLEQSARRLRVNIPEYKAGGATVRLGKTPRTLLEVSPGGAVLEGPFNAGKHLIELELFGTLKNLLGPHFHPHPPGPGRHAVQWCWDRPPKTPQPGDKYEIFSYGLFSPILIEAELA